ncbi:HAMP domain-containing protein [Brevibacterium sp. 5221]|uniref:histidine kinase n=1 Tax=Brevibacterium rongguiense TaxID=2695267 RepID=A0A6N9H3Y8_9MICO|nr:HAMP domain-containing sensor histidine kinase [Brevibacterium rongguiense]MYM18466.1 HAMP domain-containing protein [Brevibacterium rongguiense]
MTEPGVAAQAPARPRRRVTLRARLIITTVAILAVIGVGIGAAAVLAVRGSLMDDLDGQLEQLSARAQASPRGGDAGRHPFQDPLRFLSLPGQGDGTIAAVTDGSTVQGQIARAGRGASESLDAQTLRGLIGVSPDGEPRTVRLAGLGDYRVVAVEASGMRVVYGIPQTGVNAAMGATLWRTALVVVIGVAAAAVLAGLLISRALLPLRRVAQTAAEVSRLELEQGESALRTRVPDDLSQPGTEVGDVGSAVNHMLDHVDAALQARYDSELQVRRFVADASHELRTPLATIRGYADLTKPLRPDSPPQVAQALERIDAGAVRMTGLVDDLLLLARLDAGREPVEPEPVDLSALLLEIVDDAHVTAREHQFALDLPAEPVMGMAVPARAVQVIANVVANARVHTPPGTTVTASAAYEGPWAVVRIADDGPGIAPEIVDRVFDRFVRAGADRARSSSAQAAGGSSGLGLAIAKALMGAMGGDISVVSRDAGEDRGTVFALRFTAAA